jgi:dTDP-4-amino-4,6-dideoxygalactose transaminase
MKRLKEKGIQTRPVWKLNHLQIPYKNYQSYRIENANSLVEDSLCLPSSTNLNEFETNKIMDLLKK